MSLNHVWLKAVKSSHLAHDLTVNDAVIREIIPQGEMAAIIKKAESNQFQI